MEVEPHLSDWRTGEHSWSKSTFWARTASSRPYRLCCSRRWSCSSGPRRPCWARCRGSPPCWRRSRPTWAWRSAWSCCWTLLLPDPLSGSTFRWRWSHSPDEDLREKQTKLFRPYCRSLYIFNNTPQSRRGNDVPYFSRFQDLTSQTEPTWFYGIWSYVSS